MEDIYYITASSGVKFINEYTQYSIKSLIKTGISINNIFCAVNNEQDKTVIVELISKDFSKNIFIVNEDLSHVSWSYMSGKRKYSLFKAAAMYKCFSNFYNNNYLVVFDGDVLWYKNPNEFFEQKKQKTWFHHGKGLQKRCKLPKSEINVKDYNSLKKWIDPTWAYLFIKYRLDKSRLPDREVVAGLYLLHPKDRRVFKTTYEGCKIISRKFGKGKPLGEGEAKSSEGEQKPFNAALCKLNIDWHGGSKFLCPEHKNYFDHFFGSKEAKKRFRSRIKTCV